MINIWNFEVGSCFVNLDDLTYFRLVLKYPSSNSFLFEEFYLDENGDFLPTNLRYRTFSYDECCSFLVTDRF